MRGALAHSRLAPPTLTKLRGQPRWRGSLNFITRPTWRRSPICQKAADDEMIRRGTAVGAQTNLNKELQRTCSATKAAQRTGHEEPCAKRFIPNPSPIMTTTPLVSVLTMLSVMGYWRLLPDLPDTVKAFVDVQQVTQGFTPPPPTLPRSVPYTSKKCSVTLQGASRSSLRSSEKSVVVRSEAS